MARKTNPLAGGCLILIALGIIILGIVLLHRLGVLHAH